MLDRYNLIFLAMTYGIPMLAMGVCYTVIGRVLWGGSHIGELNQRHVEAIRSKRKVSIGSIFISLTSDIIIYGSIDILKALLLRGIVTSNF